ncbi:LOW QUALITY PROTEIN: tumor necrosis factor receptor superfamily member 26-like [Bubalus kerabau]|uniref:LOW QUALITY PROTEIN: tumor necrosis factor receptor superfamily member 26-like n=1 Tax=Bubalus carabanensis TaxID=3119969 RepID=UPI00244E5EC0|nr:LOW QUALITY PROTEIN: tumor necrosis factor receptor superfamily member 26-like [Bubalus carabanensis]
MPGMRAVFWSLILIQVAVATGETSCNPGEYEVPGDLSCSRFCPAGYYVSRPIDQDHHIGACSQCESGTFRAHPNEQTQCTPCAKCREDQEVVKRCTATSDQECQCQPGKFFCDSVNCRESCFRCTRCEGDSAILQPCNATSNTICAVNPQSGNSGSSGGAYLGVRVEVYIFIIFILSIVLVLIIVIAAVCYFVVYPGRRESRNKLRDSSQGISQSSDLEKGPPTPSEDISLDSVESSALLASKGPGGAELLPGDNGSLAAPGEQESRPECSRTPGPPGQAEPATPWLGVGAQTVR